MFLNVRRKSTDNLYIFGTFRSFSKETALLANAVTLIAKVISAFLLSPSHCRYCWVQYESVSLTTLCSRSAQPDKTLMADISNGIQQFQTVFYQRLLY